MYTHRAMLRFGGCAEHDFSQNLFAVSLPIWLDIPNSRRSKHPRAWAALHCGRSRPPEAARFAMVRSTMSRFWRLWLPAIYRQPANILNP
jgi:hypothetical protein